MAARLNLERAFGQIVRCCPWYLLKRIRKAMGQRDANYLLSGLMEMDEGFFGGRKPGKRGAWYGTEKGCHCAVQSVRERNPDVSSDAGSP